MQLTHLCVNSYFMSKVYFGCGIMSIIDAQDMELRWTRERPLARKSGLGSNLSRKITHGRVTAIGVGIVAPKTAISTLTLKLCVLSQKNEF